MSEARMTNEGEPSSLVIGPSVFLRHWWVIGGAFVILALAGCGGPADRAAVKGRVTCANRPLANGLIVFTPDAERGQRGPGAHARLDADGRYELPITFRLAPGWYRVTVAGPVDAPAEAPRVAERYRYPERSGLQAEVRDQPEYEFNFALDGP